MVQTPDSDHAYPVAANELDQQFAVAAPNRVWTADITYIPTDEGWLYLAVIIDLCSRMVVGWSMAQHLRSELACAALRMALERRRPAPGPAAPQRSGRAVRVRGIPGFAQSRRAAVQHEPAGQLLRQRSDGKLHGHSETGAGVPEALWDAAAGAAGSVRVY